MSKSEALAKRILSDTVNSDVPESVQEHRDFKSKKTLPLSLYPDYSNPYFNDPEDPDPRERR